jgi:soluble lytic murein transglycosylase-like protein
LMLAFMALAPRPASAACWEEAGRLYGVAPELLYAVARAESDLNASAVNLSHRARTGTYDIGLMQINSSHLRKLAAFGISERDLYDPCINTKVGAWLLADAFARLGVSWNAVGSYNAACSQLRGRACTEARARYAWRVYRRLPGASAPRAPDASAQPVEAPAAPRAQPHEAPADAAQPTFILSVRVSP